MLSREGPKDRVEEATDKEVSMGLDGRSSVSAILMSDSYIANPFCMDDEKEVPATWDPSESTRITRSMVVEFDKVIENIVGARTTPWVVIFDQKGKLWLCTPAKRQEVVSEMFGMSPSRGVNPDEIHKLRKFVMSCDYMQETEATEDSLLRAFDGLDADYGMLHNLTDVQQTRICYKLQVLFRLELGVTSTAIDHSIGLEADGPQILLAASSLILRVPAPNCFKDLSKDTEGADASFEELVHKLKEESVDKEAFMSPIITRAIHVLFGLPSCSKSHRSAPIKSPSALVPEKRETTDHLCSSYTCYHHHLVTSHVVDIRRSYPYLRLEGKSNFMGGGVDRGLILLETSTSPLALMPPRTPTDRAHPQLDDVAAQPQLESNTQLAHDQSSKVQP